MSIMLPTDFWKEFDQKLDQKLDKRFSEFEAKLDAKLDAKLEKLDAKFTEKLKPIHYWIKRQNDAIEDELTDAVYKHLLTLKKGYYIVKPKIFPKTIEDPSGNIITEFDGIVIVTNSLKVANYFDKHITMHETFDESGFRPLSYIVIVEAKQHVTHAKLLKKLEQKKRIEELLKKIEMQEYIPKGHITKLHLEQFVKSVGLYFGGSDIEPSSVIKLQEVSEKNELCGLVSLSGSRFSVKDMSNNFNQEQYGGKKGKI